MALDFDCDQHGAGPTSGRIVARIEGALGATLLVGADRLSVCRCDSRSNAAGGRTPWAYSDLTGVAVGHYGPLPVILLELAHGSDPIPVLILERGQIDLALDGLVTLRRLIAHAQAGARAEARPASALAHRLATA
jgi:hypothetical protein